MAGGLTKPADGDDPGEEQEAQDSDGDDGEGRPRMMVGEAHERVVDEESSHKRASFENLVQKYKKELNKWQKPSVF